MALEHAGEAVAHLVGGRADCDRAGDVGGAVLVLRAGIEQEQLVHADGAVGRLRDAVMHDCRVRPAAGDGRKRDILEQAAVAAETFQRLHRADLGQCPRRRLAFQPGQETHHCHTVAYMRGAGPCDLGGILDCLHQCDRVGAARRLAAVLRDQPRQRIGRARLVQPHGLVLELAKIAGELIGRAHVAEFFQRVAYLVVELDRIDIECRATLVRHQREGERQWRMRHVGAADVEGPGHVLRIGHQQQVGAQFADFGADALELVGGTLAGELELAQAHGAGRRGRAVAPQRVDWVVVDRHQFGAGPGAGGPQLLGIVGCVQPGIVTELGAALEMALEP